MNKNEIKKIIIEEIKDVLKEMASPEQLAADSRPEEDDITPPGIEDMSPDPIFGADPSFVEEDLDEGIADKLKSFQSKLKDLEDTMIKMGSGGSSYENPNNPFVKKRREKEKSSIKPNKSILSVPTEENINEMPRTSNIFKLSQEASIKDILQFMQRVNDVLKTYKSPGQKRPKKRFTPEEMKALATAMLKPEGFTSKDVIASTSYNSPAQANKFLKALEMKGLITLTSQLKKAQEPTRDPNAPETRGRKAKSAEFDIPDDALDMDFGDFANLDLSDPLAEDTTQSEIRGFRRDGGGTASLAKNLIQIYRDELKTLKASGEEDVEGVVAAVEKGIKSLEKGEDPKKVKNTVSTTLAKAVKNLNETTTMTNLEKYIKQQIKEAKNPLAKKMKEIENQGRIAALETKLAAVAEMIEETEGRLTRIDEDNEFKEMMDKNAVKEVRKQLKELEKAKGKLEKERAKLEGKVEKKKEVVDEDLPVAEDSVFEDAIDEDTVENAVDEIELEEDDFKLSESVKRMQKLANLKG